MFDKIIVMIGFNANKQPFFPVEQRIRWIEQVFATEPRVEVAAYDGLTVDFCRQYGAQYILRGLRTASDFEYERAIAQMNKMLFPDLETVFLLTMPEHTPINSTIVRDIIMHGGDAGIFLPAALNKAEFKLNSNQ